MLHNLERANCIHLLKIASGGNFHLFFLEKLLIFSKLASAKFDPCLHAYIFALVTMGVKFAD